MKKLLSAALAVIMVASFATVFASAEEKEGNHVLFFDGAATNMGNDLKGNPIQSDGVGAYSDNVSEYVGSEDGFTYSLDVAFTAEEKKDFRRRGQYLKEFRVTLGSSISLAYTFDGYDPLNKVDYLERDDARNVPGFIIYYAPGPFWPDLPEATNKLYHVLEFVPDDSIKFDGQWHNLSFVRDKNTVAIYHNGEKVIEHTFSAEPHNCAGCEAKYEDWYANGYMGAGRPYLLMFPKFISCYMDNVVMASPNYMTDPDNATVYESCDFQSMEVGATVNDTAKTAGWNYYLKGQTTVSTNSETGEEVSTVHPEYGYTVIELPDVKKGDANGDGKIDTKDVILLMQYNAEWDSAKAAVVVEGADANGDNKIDTKDVILLMQYNADWDSAIKILGPKG